MSTCTVCELHAESIFKIEGMDCHEEVAILEHRLKRLAGLEALDADLMGQRLRIKYDAAKLSTGSIAEAVAQTGMRAWLEHEEPALVAATAVTRQRLLVLSGAAFAAGLGGLTRPLGVPASRGLGSIRALDSPWRRVYGTSRGCFNPCGHPRHQRVDDDRGGRGDRAWRVVRGGVGRVSLRAGAVA